MKYFYNELEFEVPENVYCPREDSELLAKTLEGMDLEGKKCLEVGCGCGFLAVLMAKKGAQVTAVDINEDAVAATKENALSNNAEIVAFVSDMFENVKGKFDLIVFNPPYLPVGEDEHDITYAGGSSGREYIEMFASYAPHHVDKKGRILVIISSLTGEHEVLSLFHGIKMKAHVVTREKVPWEELIVVEAHH